MATIPRAALVTGSAKRVGRAMALALAARGYDVAVHYRISAAEAQDTARTIAEMGRRVALLRADLAVEEDVAAMVPAATRELGALGVLVNNAAIFEFDRLASMTRQSWERHMAVNLRAPALLCQAFAAQLPEDARGVVVNVIDERVLNLTPNYLSYSVSKVGLWGFTQVLARELAPRIRVNAIGPGPALPGGSLDEERFERFCASLPLARGTSPDELAAALCFILEAPAMTGQMITLDGGQQLGWLAPGMTDGS